jgi:hypothetical protein
MGRPQNPYSPIGREYAQYNINNDEISSMDEIASNPSWKGRRSFGKGKNNGRRTPNFQKRRDNTRTSNKGKGKNNANWDINYSVIPKFGTAKGITLFAYEDLRQPNLVYACKPTRPFERGLSPGNAIQPIGIAEIPEDVSRRLLEGEGDKTRQDGGETVLKIVHN